MLCHDDILLLAEDFPARLRAGLARYELLGVAGGTRASGPTWGWAGPPHAHCWVAHRDDAGRGLMLLLGSQGATVDGALTSALKDGGETAFFVVLKDRADLTTAKKQKTHARAATAAYKALRANAEDSQKSLASFLDRKKVGHKGVTFLMLVPVVPVAP